MKMSNFEKRFVNSESKGEANFQRIRDALDAVPVTDASRVIEVGCGIGTVSARISEAYGCEVVGTDIDPAQIEEAKRHYPGCTFQCEDSTRMSFDDERFDIVVTQHTFHHIPAWRDAVRELHRIMRPGGTLIWMDFILPGWLRPVARQLDKKYGVFDLGQMSNAFESVGFTERDLKRMFVGPMPDYRIVLAKS